MKIQIDGTNTVNKGAELMLYSVLEQIEERYPNSEVFFNDNNYRTSKSSDIKTKLKFKKRFWLRVGDFLSPLKVEGILRRLGLPYRFLSVNYAPSHIDIVFDASGFQYTDSFDINEKVLSFKTNYYESLKKNNTKLIFLPQAFGPFEKPIGKKTVELLNEFVDTIFARDEISLQHLVKNGFNKEKLYLYPDFTALCDVSIPNNKKGKLNTVCIIPNYRMIDIGNIGENVYVDFFVKTITRIQKKGYKVKLLNHESRGDYKLCLQINSLLIKPVTIHDNYDALAVKAEISNSCLVITSRFHGVASALNSGVPCLATSWSHKYEMLFKDYNQYDNLLDHKNIEASWARIDYFLNIENKEIIIDTVLKAKYNIVKKNIEMWKLIWGKIEGNI